MEDFKRFLYISGNDPEHTLASLLPEITQPTGRFYKTIVFAAETNEIYNRGVVYGLSSTDAQRITDLETAVEALENAQIAVKAGDKILTVEEGSTEGSRVISATLDLTYGKKTESETTKYIFLKGKGGETIAEIDATEFIKDKVVTDAKLYTEDSPEDPVPADHPEYPYIKLTFSESVDSIRFSVKSLVDIYTAANVYLTSDYSQPTIFTPGNVKTGASLETVVGELMAGIKAAAETGGVTSIGGKTGAILLEGSLVADGTINLSIDSNNKITATINGLGSAAFTDSTSYATSAQGLLADSAIQSLTIAGKTLTKESGTLTVAELTSALSLTDYVKKTDSLSASSSSSSPVIVTLGGTKGAPSVTVTVETESIETAESDISLAKAKDVKKVIEENEEVVAAAINDLRTNLEQDEEVIAAAINDLKDNLEKDEVVIAAAINDLKDTTESLDDRLGAVESDMDWIEY